MIRIVPVVLLLGAIFLLRGGAVDARSTDRIEARLYHYRAHIVHVIDGDTVVADVDLGMSAWRRGERLRLYRIDTPELRGPDRLAGEAARDFLRGLLQGRKVVIGTVRDRKGKYGRYLAEIWLDGRNINDLLVERGHAIYRGY